MTTPALFPAGLLGGPTTRRSARDWVVDVVMAVLTLLFGIAILAADWSDHPRPLRLVDPLLGVLAWSALWQRRRHPFGVALLAVAVSGVSGSASGAALAATFSLALRGSRRSIVTVAALGIATSFTYPLVYPGHDRSLTWNVVAGILLTGVVVGWGLFARARRDVVASLRERADRAEADQRLREEQAREAERRRIAREMHDVLGHRLSLLSVHAGAMEFRPDAPPEEIAAAAGVIREAARAALDELRDVMGLLRENSQAQAQPDGQAAPKPPQPTLDRIPSLVEESRAAGMAVRLSSSVDAHAAVPDSLGRTAFRVVQEGLTNARKHSPGSAVAVSLDGARGTDLVVEVVSRGRTAGPRRRDGRGLVGLAERVTLAGGRLVHGPDGDSFVLRAVLPWS